jgi:hypothetical protein
MPGNANFNNGEGRSPMRNHDLRRTVCGSAVLAAALVFGLDDSRAGDRVRPDTLPVLYSGLLDDHTPSAAVVNGGPYEMHGKWSLEVDERRGTGKFSAVMDMQTSDYGITQGNVLKDDPATRGAHTHHISMTDGVLTLDWQARCPQFAPAVTEGFAITGTAFVTGNGSPAPFGNPSPFTVCVLGGGSVKFSNITVTFGTPASRHFGTQAIHGVVQWCSGRFLLPSHDCTLEE